MSLFDELSAALQAGHAAEVDHLIGDERHLDPPDGGRTQAAVLVPITERSEPGVILTLRPDWLSSHAGQVAFPGGKVDPGDENAVAAALREAEEELAIPRDAVRVIGESDEYHSGSGYAITPVVGLISPDLPLEPNPDEVADWFEVPLAFLLDRNNAVKKKAIWRGSERHYYDMDYEGRRIWGVTAGIVANLSRRLQWRI